MARRPRSSRRRPARGSGARARSLLALTVCAALASPRPALAAGTPPPTPVPVPCPSTPGTCVSPSPFPTVLDTPPPSTTPPEIDARAAIVEDEATGQVLYERNVGAVRSLASTTKIMTALLVLERTSPGDVVTVGPDAAAEGGTGAGHSELGLREGERITVENLLFALMLQSSNDAAIALADHVSGSVADFVAAMNVRARRLGLRHTVFFSPNGLDDRGHSTAREVAALTRIAMRLPMFDRIVETKFDSIPAPSGPERRIQNRNVLLWLYRGATGVKTGYTARSGFCLVATADRGRRGLVAVVLGAPSTESSFGDAATLLDYGFTGYRLRTLVRGGQAMPAVPVGTERIPVETGEGLVRLLPASGWPRRAVEIRPGLHLPLATGARVGTVVFRSGGLRVGSVPLVVAGPPTGEGGVAAGPSWWVRGLDSVAGFALHTLFGLFG